jgi:hypothetical protein
MRYALEKSYKYDERRPDPKPFTIPLTSDDRNNIYSNQLIVSYLTLTYPGLKYLRNINLLLSIKTHDKHLD